MMESEIGTPIQSCEAGEPYPITEAERLTNELFAKAFASVKVCKQPKFRELTAQQHVQRHWMRDKYEQCSRDMAKIVATYPMFIGEQDSFGNHDVPKSERMLPFVRRYQHNGEIIRVEVSFEKIQKAPPLYDHG